MTVRTNNFLPGLSIWSWPTTEAEWQRAADHLNLNDIIKIRTQNSVSTMMSLTLQTPNWAWKPAIENWLDAIANTWEVYLHIYARVSWCEAAQAAENAGFTIPKPGEYQWAVGRAEELRRALDSLSSVYCTILDSARDLPAREFAYNQTAFVRDMESKAKFTESASEFANYRVAIPEDGMMTYLGEVAKIQNRWRVVSSPYSTMETIPTVPKADKGASMYYATRQETVEPLLRLYYSATNEEVPCPVGDYFLNHPAANRTIIAAAAKLAGNLAKICGRI